MAAVKHSPTIHAPLTNHWMEGSECGRGAAWRFLGGVKSTAEGEVAEEGRCAVVGMEAAEEFGVGDEALPALAHNTNTGEGGGLWWEAKEDLKEEVIR